MSFTSKPKPSPRQRLSNQKTADQTFPNPPEPPQKKDRLLRGDQRNILKPNLTHEESGAANEQNTANSPRNEEFSCNNLDLLGASASDTFQTTQKDPSDCGVIEKIRIFDIDKRGDFSRSKVHLNPGSNLEEPSLDTKGAEEVDKIKSKSEIVKQVTESGNLSLKVDSTVLDKRMEPEYIPETAQEVSAEEFGQGETEMAPKDNSTLNDGETARANDQDFVSDLTQSDLDCLKDDHSTLNDLKSSLSIAAAPGDDHSTLNYGLDSKCSAAGVRELSTNPFDQPKPALDAAKDDSSTFNDQTSGQDFAKGGMRSDSQIAGCEDNVSPVNDGIQQITTTTMELDVDAAIVSDANWPESELEAAGDYQSTLNSQSYPNPTCSNYKDDNTALNDIIQPILATVKVLDIYLPDGVPGPNKSLREAAKDDNSTLRAEADSFLIGQISSETLCENKHGVEKFPTRKQNLDPGLKEVGKSSGVAQTASKLENVVLETTATNHLFLEAPHTLARLPLEVDTPSFGVATPSVKADTPSLAVITPPPEKVCKNVDSKRTAVELKAVCALATPPLVVDTPTLDLDMPSLVATPFLAVDTPSFVVTVATPKKVCENVDSKRTAAGVKTVDTLATPPLIVDTPTLGLDTLSFIVATPSLAGDTPSSAVTVPTPEEVSKNVDSKRTAVYTLATPPLVVDTPTLGLDTPSFIVATPLAMATPSSVMTVPTPEKVGKNLDSKRTAVGVKAVDTLATPPLVVDTPTLGLDTPSFVVATPSLGVDTPILGLHTPSFLVATPSLAADTPSSVVTMPTPEKVGKNVDSKSTAIKSEGPSTMDTSSSVVDTPSSVVDTPSSVVDTPSSVVDTPFLVVTTPSLVVIAPSPDKVGEHFDAKGTASVTDTAKNAPVNQKTIPLTKDILNPTPVIMITPILDESTPIGPDATRPSLQTTPTTSETTPTSLQNTLSCDQTSLAQDTPLPEQTTSSVTAQPPLRAARLRGYLMKRGGALKAWKQRWFVFEEEKNALVYYRTPRDMTPLGQVCLSHASFTCEGAEPGLFYMHTPERTVTLKAQSEELKFYWLQQLQLRRWIHRPHSAPANTAGAELFPQLECAEEVNTEETTSQPLLLQLSLKHPLIELQNSVQMLRRRSSNDSGQSVFHVPAPPLTSPTTPSTNQSAGMLSVNQEAGRDAKSIYRKSSPAIIQATPLSSQTPPAAPQTTPIAAQVTMRRRSRMFLRRSVSSWSERSRLQQELQDQKDLVVVLQKALELCQAEKRSSRMDQSDLSESSRDREDLGRSTESLEDLRRRLEQSQAEAEELKTSLEQKDQTVQDLKKEVRELSEKNLAKQQVIQKLSSCVSRWAEQDADVDQGSVQNLVQQNQDLQDDLKAFRKQNHFLNSEIHHLSGLWRTSTESQRVLMSKVSVQRGQYLQVLRELQEVSLRDGSQSEALKNIIKDALSLEQSQLQAQGQRDRDQYGFQLVQDFEVEDIKLLIKIQAPDLRSTQSQDAVERPLVARWDQFMSSCRGELSPSPELKGLIRTGIPPQLRPQVWNWIIRTRTQRDQDPLQYQQLCEQMESSPQSGSRPWSRQIDLDLPRTLCTNHNFSSPSSPALQQLRRILLAFSWENPSIGYCQGLNRIAGLLLLVLGSEEDTFWALKAVVENIMPPEYYSPSLVGSQADQLVLKDFLAEKLPRLSSHLDRCGVDVSSSTFTWFLVVFVEVLPSHILLPLWDAFLYEGSKVLFRFSLALFKLKEPEILQLSTPLELHQYFRVLPKTVPDYRRLSAVAFDELNPFSRRAVRSRRALHLERLQRELSDLRRQQSLFLSQRSSRKSTDDENAGADQEEALDNNSEED